MGKSIGIAVVITVLMLWAFGALMDSAMADLTSNGATTNDQINTSGSNTAITGGYESTATTNYQSGSSQNNTTNSTTTNTTNSYTGDLSLIHISEPTRPY